MRTLKLITRFYSGIFFANLLITLSCIGLIVYFGSRSRELIGVLFWYKIITIGIIFYATIFYRKKELYYYQNLGVSKVKLGVATSVFDFSLWLIPVIFLLHKY